MPLTVYHSEPTALHATIDRTCGEGRLRKAMLHACSVRRCTRCPRSLRADKRKLRGSWINHWNPLVTPLVLHLPPVPGCQFTSPVAHTLHPLSPLPQGHQRSRPILPCNAGNALIQEEGGGDAHWESALLHTAILLSLSPPQSQLLSVRAVPGVCFGMASFSACNLHDLITPCQQP